MCDTLDLFSNKCGENSGYLGNKVFVGDNMNILRRLDVNSIDFIYIDPPYNTNNKFSYNDTNDNWGTDILHRLELAKVVLKQSGIICISIDDNELATLLMICYSVFQKKNYLGTFITRQAQRSNAKYINITHEYVVVFAKDKRYVPQFFIKRMNLPDDAEMIQTITWKVAAAFKQGRDVALRTLKELLSKYASEKNISWIKNYSNIDENGRVFFAKDLSTPSKPNELRIDEMGLVLPKLKTRGWSSKDKFLRLYGQNRLCFRHGRPYEIQYLDEATENVNSVLNFYSRQGTNDLKRLGLDGIFDTPKPVELIKFLIRATMHKNAKILDFYAGSGTTGQAVYEVNKEDKKKHSFILVQKKEMVTEKSSVYAQLKKQGIENPTVVDVLLIRLNTYLKKNHMNVDFEVKEF